MAVDHNNPQSRDEEILIATIDGEEYDKIPQSRIEELLLELKEVIEAGGGGGTSDYENLTNQPQVNGETLIGDKTGADLGLVDAEEGKGLSTNDYDDAEKSAVAAATSAISAMKDGTDLDSFGDVEVALLDKADISDLGTAAAKDSTNAVTSGSTNLVESGAVKDAIDAAVSSAYHHAGTKTVAQLTHDLLVAANEGNVYNITDSGTTTSDFIEGIGKTIYEGSNVGICKVGNVYMFDLLSGFVDTTNFVQKSQTSGLLKNDGTVNDEIEDDVDQLKSGLTNLDNEVNGDATTYPYADVITISDAVPSNLAECNVKIEPVQDLHGYDKPWVGGAGKNKLPLVLADIKAVNTDGTWADNVYSINNGTITVNTDDGGNVESIKLNGTFNAITYFDFVSVFNSTEYAGMIYNGSPSQANATVRVSGSDRVSIQELYNGYAINDNGDNLKISIRVGGTVTINNEIFYPMIRLSTETDATFAPYTNICPITGHTEASVQRDGKNLLSVNSYSGSGTWFSSKTFPVLGRYLYRRANFTTSGGGAYTFKVVGIKNGVETDIDTSAYTGDMHTYNDVSAYDFVKVSGYSNNSNNAITNAMLCFNDNNTDTIAYEPYAGKTYTIAFGDTIYGGTVDFDSGVMTVDRVDVDLSTLTWTATTLDRWYTSDITDIKAVSALSQVVDAISDSFVAYSSDALYNDTSLFGMALHTNGNIFVRNGSTSDTPTGHICYKLATPTTIQLTPQQIQLLKGTNTITASTGQISVTANGVSAAIGSVQEQVNELAGEHRLIAESGTTGTLSAKIDSLYSAYTALTDEEKQRCYLVYGNTFNIRNVSVSNRKFGSVGKLNVGSLFVESVFIQISASGSTMIKLIVNATGNSFEDMSSTENNNKVQLYI